MKIGNPRRFAIVCFVAGILASVLVMSVVSLIGGAHLVSSAQYKYYKDLSRSFGKYYSIEQSLKNEALYEYDDQYKDKFFAGGLMAGVTEDKYAQYLDKNAYQNMRKRLFDSYVGIGVSIKEAKNGIVIQSVTEGGPAEEAGIRKGDIIKKIDDKTAEDVDAAIEAIDGVKGTAVKITVERDGDQMEFTVYRVTIKQDSVNYKVYKDDIGYIKISSFIKGTGSELDTAVNDLKNRGCTKLIIDLRDNTGGITDEGFKVADMLLPACKITTCKYKAKDDEVHNSKESNTGCKYVLLVNRNTASASEIVTSAVKDNKGGKIIGETTFGKGLIQTIKTYKDGTAVKYTIGEYFSPKGHKINGKGITPDIETSESKAVAAAVKALEEK